MHTPANTMARPLQAPSRNFQAFARSIAAKHGKVAASLSATAILLQSRVAGKPK